MFVLLVSSVNMVMFVISNSVVCVLCSEGGKDFSQLLQSGVLFVFMLVGSVMILMLFMLS